MVGDIGRLRVLSGIHKTKNSPCNPDTIYAAFKTLDDATKKFYVGTRVAIPADFLIKVKIAPVTNGTVVAQMIYAISATLVYETLD